MLKPDVALKPAECVTRSAALHIHCTAMQNQATMCAITTGNQLASSIVYKLYGMLCWYCKITCKFRS